MKSKQVIAVIGNGGTAWQVAEALAREGAFTVELIVDERIKPAAAPLHHKGIQIVSRDYFSVATIAAALKNAHGVYACTTGVDEEFAFGKMIVDAIRKTDIRHFVMETRPGYHALSNSLFRVPSFDIKAALERYCRQSALPATFIHPAYYYEHFMDPRMFTRLQSGELYFGFPQGNTALAMISLADIGPIVAMIFRFPCQYIGRTVGLVGDDRICADYADILSELLKRKIVYRNIPNTEYIYKGGAVEDADMFDVQRLFVRSRNLDLIESYGLHPGTQPFHRWVKRNKQALQRVMNSLDGSAIS